MLNETLKKIRIEKGFTQDEIAEYLKIKRQTYSAYERGVSVPDANTLNEIAKFFNVTADYLLGNTKNPKPLNIPDELDDLKVAFHKGGIESLTQEEIDKLVEIAKILKDK